MKDSEKNILDTKLGKRRYSKLIILGAMENYFYTKGLMSFHPRSMFLPIVILVTNNHNL
jgi:hypothetical protein